ncbi:amino acid/polyamine transporter I [Fusarium solani]|uniref:Amino acid/polyamine transporter I n=1 Tax=Fusarium solani TaxID=169388 RepID=A0A9P9FZ18_FUSSL|nr:amino acid/polyamine transporter I [Fusarium solani]KAH7224244.1 amino acid/polyamine transporter I [Fusarium solani]
MKSEKTSDNNVLQPPLEDSAAEMTDNMTEAGTTELRQIDTEQTHFKKDLGWLAVVAASFDCMATWNTFPSTLLVSFVYGGPAATVWGIILVGLIYIPIAITLCELVSAYPSVGGQYHWAGVLAPAKYRRGISYICGSISWFSWVSLTAAGAGALGNFAMVLVTWFNPAYVLKKYHVFLFYQCSNLFSFLVNAYGQPALSTIYRVSFAFSLLACFIIFIATLAGQKDKRSSSFVWTTLENNTGWPDGIAFLITLSGPTVMYCPIDGVVHLVEDVKRPRIIVPRAILTALTLSFISATAFGIATTYCISDFETALMSRTGFPAFEIWRQAMNSDAWAVAFVVFLLVMVPASTLTTTQVVSRMTWSFANDQALLFSDFLKVVSPKLKVPLRALLFNAGLVFLIGCLYLISSTAFIAILNISVVFQQITLAFPSALLIYRRRDPEYLPKNRPFKVPNAIGWMCNIISVLYAIIAVIFFQFPWSTDVQFSTTMNFTCLVFGSFICASALAWFLLARKRYTPPSFVFRQDL